MASPASVCSQHRIGQLSPELRLMIFREAVRQDQPIRIADNNQAVNVLLACRLFRAEATEWYYRENTFLVDDPGDALMWCSRIGPLARFVRSVQLEVDISPLDDAARVALGVPQGGHDSQWKGIVGALPQWFPLLEELRLVIAARLLQAEVGPNAQPRIHRYSDMASELEAFHTGSQQGCLTTLKTSCPKFSTFRLGSSFHRDWELHYCDLIQLVAVETTSDGLVWFEVRDAPPPPPEESDDDDDEDDDDDDDDDDDEDDEDDQDGPASP